MPIRRLEISQFRNLDRASLDLGEGFNVLQGPNGAGKTAVLEAVHLLARGQSFRGRDVAPLVMHGRSETIVRADVCAAAGPLNVLAMRRARTGRADLRIDGVGDCKQSELAALLPIHVVLPSVGDLVFGSPAERRRFLDWGVFHVEHAYIDTLRRAARITRQRNALLRRVQRGSEPARALEAWTPPLVDIERRVTDARRRYVARLIPVLEATLAALEPELSVVVDFYPGWSGESFVTALGDGQAAEVKWGATRFGPHRADLRLTVPGGRAGSTLSRGQGKLVAQALILAQIEVLGQVAGGRAILLVDDLAAEIDPPRASRLMSRMAASGAQVIATSMGSITASSWPDGPGRVFHVKHGVITPAA